MKRYLQIVWLTVGVCILVVLIVNGIQIGLAIHDIRRVTSQLTIEDIRHLIDVADMNKGGNLHNIEAKVDTLLKLISP